MQWMCWCSCDGAASVAFRSRLVSLFCFFMNCPAVLLSHACQGVNTARRLASVMRNPLYWGASGLLLVAAACSSDGGIFGVANREPGSSLDASLGGPSRGSGGVRSGAGGARGDGGASGGRAGGAGGSDC